MRSSYSAISEPCLSICLRQSSTTLVSPAFLSPRPGIRRGCLVTPFLFGSNQYSDVDCLTLHLKAKEVWKTATSGCSGGTVQSISF